MAATEFIDGEIDGVILVELKSHADERGWLMEVFRSDEIDESQAPAMGYVSQTNPGVVRGPHEHEFQTDHFVITGPDVFEFCLWDRRESSPTFGRRKIVQAGGGNSLRITVPPGVVHAYKNTSDRPAFLMNFPDKLYAGENRTEPVDERRWEQADDDEHPFHW